MYNLLIVEDDLVQSHFLANSIAKNIADIRLCGMLTTGKEALSVLADNVIDILILDLKLPDVSGLEILDYIRNQGGDFSPSVIVLTSHMNLLAEIIHHPCVYAYHSKVAGAECLLKTLSDLLLEKKQEKSTDVIKNLITKELTTLHYNFSYVGTKYLSECIYHSYYKTDRFDINLNKEIYPILSKKYHKTINSIKCNIYQATNAMYYDIEEETLCHYLGYQVNHKPKAKDIIKEVLAKIS
jgi:CheY-like chemotaxis protein